MMRLTRRALLLVAISLLTSAATANAECAWVLWMEETRLDYATNKEDHLWHTTAAAANQIACEKRLLQEIETVTHPQNPPQRVMHKVSGQSVDFIHFDSDDPKARSTRFQRFNYTCLPDTVDPARGPKGK